MMAGLNRYFRYFTYIKPILRIPLVRTYGYLIFTILMTIIFIVFAIKPTVQTIVVLQKQVSDQSMILAKMTEKTDSLSLARQNYQNLDQTVSNKIERALPRTPDIANLVKSLEETTLGTEASISALQFQPITIEKDEGEQTLKEIMFTYNIEGTYQTLKLILQNLRTSDRVITIDNLVFNKIEASNNILMSVTGKAYFLK